MAHVVAGNFLKTITGAFQVVVEVHKELVLCTGKLCFINWISKRIELFKSNIKEISRVAASTLNVDTEDARV